MPKLKPDTIWPTPEEDTAIRAAIAEYPDTFEADEEWFREARPFKEVLPHLWEAWYGQQSNELPPSPENGTVERG